MAKSKGAKRKFGGTTSRGGESATPGNFGKEQHEANRYRKIEGKNRKRIKKSGRKEEVLRIREKALKKIACAKAGIEYNSDESDDENNIDNNEENDDDDETAPNLVSLSSSAPKFPLQTPKLPSLHLLHDDESYLRTQFAHDSTLKKQKAVSKLQLTKTGRSLKKLQERMKNWDGVAEHEAKQYRLKTQREDEAAKEKVRLWEMAGKPKTKNIRKDPSTWKLKGAARPAEEVYDFDVRYVDPFIKDLENEKLKLIRVVDVWEIVVENAERVRGEMEEEDSARAGVRSKDDLDFEDEGGRDKFRKKVTKKVEARREKKEEEEMVRVRVLSKINELKGKQGGKLGERDSDDDSDDDDENSEGDSDSDDDEDEEEDMKEEAKEEEKEIVIAKPVVPAPVKKQKIKKILLPLSSVLGGPAIYTEYLQTLLSYGWTLTLSSQFSKARQSFKKLIDINPRDDHVYCRWKMIRLYLISNHPDSARRLLDSSLCVGDESVWTMWSNVLIEYVSFKILGEAGSNYEGFKMALQLAMKSNIYCGLYVCFESIMVDSVEFTADIIDVVVEGDKVVKGIVVKDIKNRLLQGIEYGCSEQVKEMWAETEGGQEYLRNEIMKLMSEDEELDEEDSVYNGWSTALEELRDTASDRKLEDGTYADVNGLGKREVDSKTGLFKSKIMDVAMFADMFLTGCEIAREEGGFEVLDEEDVEEYIKGEREGEEESEGEEEGGEEGSEDSDEEVDGEGDGIDEDFDNHDSE